MTTMKPNSGSSINKNGTVFSNVKYEHLVAGISGGVTSTLILHPLDLVKIRFAVNDGRTIHSPQYESLTSAFRLIFKEEGIRGLYRGVTPNVCGSGFSWGFYFFFYNHVKTRIQGGNTKKPLGPALHMLAAAQAGILTLIMTNPIWVVKTRLCLQSGSGSSFVHHSDSSKIYNGMIDALVKIYKFEGVRGLYKGFVPGMIGVSHGAIQFMTYEEMKNRYNNYYNKPIDGKLGTLEYITFAALSKLVAAATTYPYQVIRARLQDQHHSYLGTWDCIKQTFSDIDFLKDTTAKQELITEEKKFANMRAAIFSQVYTHICSMLEHRMKTYSKMATPVSEYEGLKGFYKGISANLTRVVPATMITFTVYENVSHFLKDL